MFDLGVITKEVTDKDGKIKIEIIGEKRCMKCNKRLCECERDANGNPLWMTDAREIIELKQRMKNLEDKVYGV